MIIKNGKRLDGFCVDSLPIGTLQPYLGLKAPNGYLICDGSLISKTVYPDLYAICGSLFGTETDTHFYLPDLRGKTIAGYNENNTSMNTIGKLLGEEAHRHISPTSWMQYQDTYWHGFTNDLDYTTRELKTFYGSEVTQKGTVPSTATNLLNYYTDEQSSYQPTMVANWIVKAKMITPVTAYVENSLTSTNTENALSAAQGKILNDKFANYMSLQGGTVNGTIGLYATTQDMGIAFSAYDSSSGAQLSMGIGSSHINHGIYSDSLDKWLIYANQETGDVIIPRNILIGDTGFTNVGMKMVSNTNGRAILFDNGLMMCMGHVQGTTSSSENTALGAANIAYVHCDWTYPQAFKTVYHVMATCDDLDNGFYVAEVDGTPGLSTMRVALGGSASKEVGAYVFAIGAWK